MTRPALRRSGLRLNGAAKNQIAKPERTQPQVTLRLPPAGVLTVETALYLPSCTSNFKLATCTLLLARQPPISIHLFDVEDKGARRVALFGVDAVALHLGSKLDVEQPVVLLLARDVNVALELVPRRTVNGGVQAEGLLAPVGGTGGVRCGAEANLVVGRVFCAALEQHVEVAAEGFYRSAIRHVDREVLVELLELLNRDLVQVKALEAGRTAKHLAGVRVGPLAGALVELTLLSAEVVAQAVQVNLVVVVHLMQELRPALHGSLELCHPLLSQVCADGCHVHVGMAGVQRTPWLQEPVTRHQHAVQHALPQQEVAHPFRDDDVHLLWEIDGLNGALDHLNHSRELVVFHQPTCVNRHGGRLHGVHLACTCFGSKDGQDA
mmetsp:Transcript_15156/g.32897  ORF Transcript_15156/g.32897 Transcript_15156/m.32897 type:complete len:380 (-) Transcript_15156:498-1637(-)